MIKYIGRDEMREVFTFIPLLKGLEASIKADLKIIEQYDGCDDVIDGVSFNHKLSDMPHSNTGEVSMPVEKAVNAMQNLDKEKKQMAIEITKELYIIATIREKTERAFKSLPTKHQRLIQLKLQENKNWGQTLSELSADFYSEKSLQRNLKRALTNAAIVARIESDTFDSLKIITNRFK